jgi:hypothetical protein
MFTEAPMNFIIINLTIISRTASLLCEDYHMQIKYYISTKQDKILTADYNSINPTRQSLEPVRILAECCALFLYKLTD